MSTRAGIGKLISTCNPKIQLKTTFFRTPRWPPPFFRTPRWPPTYFRTPIWPPPVFRTARWPPTLFRTQTWPPAFYVQQDGHLHFTYSKMAAQRVPYTNVATCVVQLKMVPETQKFFKTYKFKQKSPLSSNNSRKITEYNKMADFWPFFIATKVKFIVPPK